MRLVLEGFIGIRNGLGVERIEVDLTELPKGLIALIGPNGIGKTTILENLHPYRYMPSRAGQERGLPSVAAFSYYDEIYAPNARKELDWKHGGKWYRTEVVIRNTGKTKKADAYLFEVNLEGNLTPVRLLDGTVSDGKAETYDRCVEALIGPIEAFFTTQFAAQGQRPLSAYQPADFKKLLVEMLGYEKLIEDSGKALAVSKILGGALQGLQQKVADLPAKRLLLDKTRQKIVVTGQEIANLRQAVHGCTTALALHESERASLVAQQTSNTHTHARILEINTQLAELQRVEGNALATLSSVLGRVKTSREGLDGQMSSATEILGQREEIAKAVIVSRDLSQQVDTLSSERSEIVAAIAALQPKAERFRHVSSAISSQESGIDAEQRIVGNLSEQTSVMSQVPCVTLAIHETCPLLSQARDAAAKVAISTVTLKQMQEQLADGRVEHAELVRPMRELEALNQRLTALDVKLKKANADSLEVHKLVAKAPLIENASATVQRVTNEMLALSEVEREARDQSQRNSAECGEKRGRLTQELVGLSASDKTQLILDVDKAINQAKKDRTVLEGALEEKIREEVGEQISIQSLEQDILEASATEAKVSELSAEIAEWVLLSKAFGNDGIIALSIDDTGPSITKIVNDLLLECYGPRFTVEFRTQRELASGSTRETFAVMVHDSDSGEWSEVSKLSFGQRVWINEALARGVALYRSSLSGTRSDVIFSDEADGALDLDHKRLFIQMKRAVLMQGGYEQEFFVSHSQEVWNYADAQIDVRQLV